MGDGRLLAGSVAEEREKGCVSPEDSEVIQVCSMR